MYTRYARLFDRTCVNWTEDPFFNLRYLKRIQDICNQQLYSIGYVFLCDVYKMIERTWRPEYEGIGWWLDMDDLHRNKMIDFGIYDHTKKTSRDFVNGLQPEIILDFNVDGKLSEYLIDRAICAGGPDLMMEFFNDDKRYKQFLIESGWEDFVNW